MPAESHENVADSDSDLTDLDDLEDDEVDNSNIVETEATEKSINPLAETEGSGRTRIVQTERSHQLSMEKQVNATTAMSGRTGKTARQASAE